MPRYGNDNEAYHNLDALPKSEGASTLIFDRYRDAVDHLAGRPNPDASVHELALMTDREAQRIIDEFTHLVEMYGLARPGWRT